MAFDLEKLKKIPIFKNVDFEDPRSRKRVGMAFAAVALVLIMIVANLAKSEPKSAAQTAQNDVFLEVPEGEDQDVLDADDMVDVRMRRTPGNKDIFNASAVKEEDNPLGFLGGEDSTSAEPEPEAMTPESRRSRAKELFGLSSADHDTPETQDITETQASPADRRAAAANAFGVGSGEPAQPKKTPAPKKASSPKKNTQATAKADPVPEEPESKASQGVRRSGSISSLDGDWGTVEGISSLDNESQYVNQDEDHPYKVMFTRDQKIKSGERITIRLLEDMAVNGILIPRNTHLSATCQIGERLEIHVSNIEINGKIYALNYTAFDNDGSQGLYCPTTEGNRASQQAKSSAGSSATSAISSAAAIAGAAMGSSALGSMIGSMTNVGAQAVTGRGGSVTAEVNSGYVFYLLKDI